MCDKFTKNNHEEEYDEDYPPPQHHARRQQRVVVRSAPKAAPAQLEDEEYVEEPTIVSSQAQTVGGIPSTLKKIAKGKTAQKAQKKVEGFVNNLLTRIPIAIGDSAKQFVSGATNGLF